MQILAIDPGPKESAWLLYDTQTRRICGDAVIGPNYKLLGLLPCYGVPCHMMAIEMVACMGMAVGAEVFETAYWIGRFVDRWEHFKGEGSAERIYRKDEKMCLCGSMQAKDANIRQALIDLFGGESTAIGGKKCPKCHGKGWVGVGRPICTECQGSKWKLPPGPLFGLHDDLWSALAVVVTYAYLHTDE